MALATLSGGWEPIAAARLVSGHPEPRLAPAFSSGDGQFDGGLWEATEGAWRSSYTENAVRFILAGRLRLTALSGETVEFAADEAFLILRRVAR
jgi:uncharacterized cupin superfamily protein